MALRQEHHEDLVIHVLTFHLLDGFRLTFCCHVLSHVVELF